MTSQIIPLQIYPFESGKFGKERKKLQKFEYLKNEKSFLDELKNIFHNFWTAIIWCKNKNLIKNSGHQLKALWCSLYLFFPVVLCILK